MATDLLGEQLSEMEQQLLKSYDGLKQLLERDDLPPCVSANTRQALAALYQAVNDLGLRHETLYQLGV